MSTDWLPCGSRLVLQQDHRVPGPVQTQERETAPVPKAAPSPHSPSPGQTPLAHSTQKWKASKTGTRWQPRGDQPCKPRCCPKGSGFLQKPNLAGARRKTSLPAAAQITARPSSRAHGTARCLPNETATLIIHTPVRGEAKEQLPSASHIGLRK